MQYLEIAMPIIEAMAGVVFTILCAYVTRRLKLNDDEQKAFVLIQEQVASSYQNIVKPFKLASADGKLTEKEKTNIRNTTGAEARKVAKGAVYAVLNSWSIERTNMMIEKAVNIAKGKK